MHNHTPPRIIIPNNLTDVLDLHLEYAYLPVAIIKHLHSH